MEKPISTLDALYNFKVRKNSASPSSSFFYIEHFTNLEKAPKRDLEHLISLITPVALKTFSQSDVADLNNFFFFNHSVSEIVLSLVRDSKTHEIEGYMVFVVWVEYFLQNNYAKENEFTIQHGFAVINQELRNKKLFHLLSNLYYSHQYLKHAGKNYFCFDVNVNPAAFKYLSENETIYPCYHRQVPVLVKDFMVRIMEKYKFESLSEEKPFLVKDCSPSGIDERFWKSNYEKLSYELKYFLDETELRPGYGLLHVKFINMLQGNTLGVPACQYSQNYKIPDLLVKEHCFSSPKL